MSGFHSAHPAVGRRLSRVPLFLSFVSAGILVGTLGVAGYRSAIERVRSAAQRVGKKTYTLLVGKPSPAKLANFPEVEVRLGVLGGLCAKGRGGW